MSPQTLGRSDNDAKGLGDKVENRTVRTNEVQTRNLARRGRRHVRVCTATGCWSADFGDHVSAVEAGLEDAVACVGDSAALELEDAIYAAFDGVRRDQRVTVAARSDSAPRRFGA